MMEGASACLKKTCVRRVSYNVGDYREGYRHIPHLSDYLGFEGENI